MSALLALPDEVLKLILQHIGIRNRLGSCSLVCRRLQAAAAAATHEVMLEGSKVEPGLQWLSKYGQHITSLSLRLGSFPQPLQQLPSLPRLQDLYVYGGNVRLGPTAAGSHPGIMQGITQLTCLTLSCDVLDAGLIDSLSGLVHLQQLILLPGLTGASDDSQSSPIQGLSGGTLLQLTQLTYLNVRGLSDENVLQLGDLPRLRTLCWREQHGGGTLCSVPGLAFPASLDTLVLMSPIQAGVLSLVPTGLQQLFVEGVVEGPAEGPGSFLSCIGRLQQLTALLLDCVFADGVAWPPPGPAYSALTASSSLVQLQLSGTCPPNGIWPFVFPAAHKLPHLTRLQLDREVDGTQPVLLPDWGAADLSCLVSCAPNLIAIDGMSLQAGSHVSELHKLTGLARLGAVFSAPNTLTLRHAMVYLAAVTQLRSLKVAFRADMAVAALLPLTSLTALVDLKCHMLGSQHLEVYLHSWAPSAPDVWLQLLELCCADDPSAQPAAIRSLAQQLAEERALTTTLQESLVAQVQLNATHQELIAGHGAQLASLEALTATLQESLATQVQLNATQQAQIAAQQEVVAGHGARLAALEGLLLKPHQ